MRGQQPLITLCHMHFVIYGAGAIGGVIGSHLHRTGIPTTLVARGPHLDAIQESGLTVDAADGARTYRVQGVANASEVVWHTDSVVLLCVKSHQTEVALRDLRAHAPRDTVVVSVQNGVANEATILRVFPRTYSICVMMPATHLEPGVVVQGSSGAPGILDIGTYPGGTDETAAAIARDLRAASFISEARSDIMAWKYRKLVRNLGNGVDACFEPGSGAAELERRAQREGETVLAAAGIDLVSDATELARRGCHIVRRSPFDGNHSSTWQSIERGSDDVEIDYLTGEITLLGRLHGVSTPVNDLVQSETARMVRERLAAGSLSAVEALQSLGPEAIGA
ncbi:2-dehydropantoate 2-reductase [Gordonia sp. CPCC 206044]|uniref:ketopantoate reductase family protein n=1 Tax=Gordonia sp. CPCC 206044 TaxID=3140793 RepID=UPI003AF35D4C